MLNIMRKIAGTWVARILLFLFAFSFIGWGVTGHLSKTFERPVVQVGKTHISARTYRLLYDRQLNVLSNQLKTPLTQEMIQSLNHQILDSVVSGALLDEKARLLGLALSQDSLAKLIESDPLFHDSDGKFERKKFDEVITYSGIQAEDYFDARRKNGLRQQIIAPISDGIKVSNSFLNAFALYQNEKRSVDYLILPATLISEIQEPTEEKIRQWFEENKKHYAVPERRKISFVKLEFDDIKDPSAVTEEQIAAQYQKNKAEFTEPERRHVEQLVFSSREKAEDALKQLKQGQTFEKIVADNQKTLSDVDLGSVTQEEILDQKLSQAVFSFPFNTEGEIFEGSFGFALVRIKEITQKKIKPLEDVRDHIRDTYAYEKAKVKLPEIYDSYEKLRQTGLSLKESAEQLNLKFVSFDSIDQFGKNSEGKNIDTSPFFNPLVAASFQTEENIENPPLPLDTGFIFYEVEKIYPAHERTLNEVKKSVIQDWKSHHTMLSLEKKASSLHKRLKNGESLEKIATELNLFKKTERDFNRHSQKTQMEQKYINVFFSVPNKQAGIFFYPEKHSWVIFTVTDSKTSEKEFFTDQKYAESFFSEEIANDVIIGFISHLRHEYPVEINHDILKSLSP